MTGTDELKEEHFARALPAGEHRRLARGMLETSADICNLRKYLGLTQVEFSKAMGISVHTLRNWEQGRRFPEGPALALLRIAARYPRILRESLQSAA